MRISDWSSDVCSSDLRLMVCSLVDEPVRTKSGGGMTVNAPYRLADVEQADTIVIPMWHGDDPPSAEVVDALRAAHARGVRMISFCSGALDRKSTRLNSSH